MNEIKSRMAPYEKDLKELNDKRYNLEASARNELGLWSEAGIQETRDAFWNTWRRGKVRKGAYHSTVHRGSCMVIALSLCLLSSLA